MQKVFGEEIPILCRENRPHHSPFLLTANAAGEKTGFEIPVETNINQSQIVPWAVA
jgi:hypothetical protein